MKENVNFFIWVGLDVSKDSFTAAAKSAFHPDSLLFPEDKKFAISEAGVRKLLKWAKSISDEYDFGIAMETTGYYSSRLAEILLKLDPERHVSLCNAYSVSLYARSFTEAKSDKADAGFIARYAADRNPAAMKQADPETRQLRETVRERDRLVQVSCDLRNSSASLNCKTTRSAYSKVAKALDNAISELEKAIASIVNSSEKIKNEVALMQTVPGVGFLSAAIIYAEYGSLRNYTRKQLSAMSGVCPVNCQSGTSLNRHRISHHGPRLVRRILFLDVQQTIKRVPAMAQFREKILTRSETSSKMTAVCACMRKLLMLLRGIVVSGVPFNPEYVSNPNNQQLRAEAMMKAIIEN